MHTEKKTTHRCRRQQRFGRPSELVLDSAILWPVSQLLKAFCSCQECFSLWGICQHPRHQSLPVLWDSWVILQELKVCPRIVKDVEVRKLWGPWWNLQLVPPEVVHPGFWSVLFRRSYCLLFACRIWFSPFVPLKCSGVHGCNTTPKQDGSTLMFSWWTGALFTKLFALCSPNIPLLSAAKRFYFNLLFWPDTLKKKKKKNPTTSDLLVSKLLLLNFAE